MSIRRSSSPISASSARDMAFRARSVSRPSGFSREREAILLDPCYTGKAMAGLIHDVRAGAIRPHETVVFLHTGGAPALFSQADPVALVQGTAGTDDRAGNGYEPRHREP